MNPVARGFRNAFRTNYVRTVAIIIILGLAIGLCLTMLVAERAVDHKIAKVKSSIGNTITIAPAGFTPGSSANNALTSSQLAKVKSLPHVVSLAESLTDRLPTTGSSLPSYGRFGASASSSGATTSLTSPVTLNLNRRASGSSFFFNGGASGNLPTSFSLPVSFLGTTDPASISGASAKLASGVVINGSSNADDALISGAMASKNNLKVGSTFTAYNTTLTVSGIFSTSNRTARGTVVLPLATLQTLSGQGANVTSAVATVDSLDNLSSTTTAIKNTLGANNADVTSAEQQADNTVRPLNSVKSVALFSLIGAVVAGAVIILLVMVMVVRERKKEIGVLKAIGGGNLRIASEFMVEALTLTIAGAIIGLVIAVLAGQPVTNSLVSSNTSSPSTSQISSFGGGGPGGFGGGFAHRASGEGFGRDFRNNGAVKGIKNIQTQIGWGIILDGLGAAIAIAIIGSILSTAMIVKVRPANILRSE